MENIEIIGNGKYLPKKSITSKQLAEKLNIEEKYILKRTGIENRYFVENEKIEDLAIEAVKDLINKNIDIKKVNMIIVATTSSNKIMPGISYAIQKKFNINNCICLDILAGCSGYINAFDIAETYINSGKINEALIIGVDILSRIIEKNDIGTAIILSDGAGATLVKKTNENKKYFSKIISEGQKGEILTYSSNEYIHMDGREIYKYAVTKTIEIIKELLEKAEEKIENIKYIIPHQSNLRIMNSIANRLGIDKKKIYSNVERVGNTFCASIPIAITEMYEENMLQKGDKIILLGYGGGLNTGSILLEI